MTSKKDYNDELIREKYIHKIAWSFLSCRVLLEKLGIWKGHTYTAIKSPQGYRRHMDYIEKYLDD